MPWSSVIQTMTLPIEVLTAVTLFCLPLRRRGYFALWPVSFVLCAVLFQAMFSMLAPMIGLQIIIVLAYSLGSYLCGLLFVLLCCRITVSEAMYCASSAYLTQHFAYCLYTFFIPESALRMEIRLGGVYVLIYGTVYLAFYLLFARRLPTHGRYDLKVTHSIGMTAGALLVALLLSAFSQQLQPKNEYFYRICLLYAMSFCVYALWAQLSQQKRLILRHDLDVQQQLWAQQKAQYETAMQNVDVINQKCHDLKHQIAALKLISDEVQRDSTIHSLEQSVMIYDAIAESGNKILDAVLTEKSLLCERQGIAWTCMADGALLDFINPVDLYTLFGNALDNAIEGSLQVPERERRNVSVTVQNRHGAAFIQVENYFTQAIRMERGLPQTSKPDKENHGFGVGSIRSVTQRYGGTMDISTDDGIFVLSVLIPLPSNS